MIYALLSAKADWRPAELIVDGEDAAAAALESGRGVVRWLLPLEMNPLLVRMIWRQFGRPLHFMSHWRHGPSKSTIGQKLFNERDCRTDAQFGPRLILKEDNTPAVLGAARRVLADGGTVGFRGIGWTKRLACYPLFDGHMDLALGAPATARQARAALFTVSTCRTEGGLRTVFAPLDVDNCRSLQDIGAEFAARLERAAIDAPSLWSVNSRQWHPKTVSLGCSTDPRP